MASLHSKPSAGHDGISVKLLKILSPALLSALTLMVNQSLITGIFPNQLKIAKIAPLFKKNDELLVDNYRPVAILPSVSKFFEKIVFNQLYQYFKSNKLFCISQYGFRDNHSTELAAMELADRTLNDIDNKSVSLAIFMDLSKAFDTLDHQILMQKLNFYGVQGTELLWFKSYLFNRFQYVELDSIKSSLAKLNTGVPQGSILGPLLFLIYMNDLTYSSDAFKFILYADDTTLYTSLTSRDDGSMQISADVAKIYDWLATNKLSLNIDKTKYMIFHAPNKKINNNIVKISINNTEIERVNDFNFLGIHFNEHMSWKTHIDKLSSKLSKITGVLNRLKRVLPGDVMKVLYFSIVQSHLNYAILLWGFDGVRLKGIQKRIVRIITCSKYNAHTDPLFKKLKLLKVDDILKLSALKFYFKHCHENLPHFFQDMSFTRHADLHHYGTRFNYFIPPNVTRTCMAQKCIRNYVIKIVNQTSPLTLDKINTHSLHGFALNMKRGFLSSYNETCIHADCYICGSRA
jgi:hypothetical protein